MNEPRVWKCFSVMMTLVLIASLGAAISPPRPVKAATAPMVATGVDHTVGLKSDGTVVAVGYNGNGQCNVTPWTDITQVSAGNGHTVGPQSDDTVVAVGSNFDCQCNLFDWNLLRGGDATPPGDANGDGEVNVLDMTKVARIILELDNETPGADCNQDSDINVLDMTCISRKILGLD